jgi:hypothetical protein
MRTRNIGIDIWRAALTASLAFVLAAPAVVADDVITDDLIVDGSLCVGNDCVEDQQFDFSTVILRENNLRMFFDDTSTTSQFPANDWEVIANDSMNAGESYLGFADRGAGLVSTSGSGTCEGGVNNGNACDGEVGCPGLCDANSGILSGQECGSDDYCNSSVGSGASCTDPGVCVAPGAIIFRIEAGGAEDSLVIDSSGDVQVSGNLTVDGSINGTPSDIQALEEEVALLNEEVEFLNGEVELLQGQLLEMQATIDAILSFPPLRRFAP